MSLASFCLRLFAAEAEGYFVPASELSPGAKDFIASGGSVIEAILRQNAATREWARRRASRALDDDDHGEFYE
jgi:hypothetical protein